VLLSTDMHRYNYELLISQYHMIKVKLILVTNLQPITYANNMDSKFMFAVAI